MTRFTAVAIDTASDKNAGASASGQHQSHATLDLAPA